MTHRRERLASSIQRAIQDILARGLDDPRVRGLITITGVEVSGDLRTAVVLTSVLPAERQDLTLHALRHAAPRIRRLIHERVEVAHLPDLEFRLDESLKRQAGVMAAIARARDERPADPGAEP